jgi:hypothetical protein
MGALGLEVEYRSGHEEVFAFKGGFGVMIARLRTSEPDWSVLYDELTAYARRKKRRIVLGGQEYRVHCQAYESFGERAWRLELEPISNASSARRKPATKRASSKRTLRTRKYKPR